MPDDRDSSQEDMLGHAGLNTLVAVVRELAKPNMPHNVYMKAIAVARTIYLHKIEMLQSN
jgi:hypothetical protein